MLTRKAGTESNETPFRQNLQLKVGARVMLTYNIDVTDGLANGARGEIIGFHRQKGGHLDKVMVKFDENWQEEERRKLNHKLLAIHPGCTPIERVMFQYSIGRKATKGSNTARVVQFPLKLCFATTAHKFQGQTVVKPLKIVVDLRTVFAAAMAYVMLSRVQCQEQLYILGSLPENKIYADPKALEELERMEKISINNNPCKWECKLPDSIKIFSLNCHSLKKRIGHISVDPIVAFSDIICLSETWLMDNEDGLEMNLSGFELHTVCVGHGKGLATYFRKEKFKHCSDVKFPNIQLTKLSSASVDVISVYKSKDGSLLTLAELIVNMVDPDKTTLICGDFNICLRTNRRNLLREQLEILGFSQQVKEATHLQGGLIDHVYYKKGKVDGKVDVSLYSPYYTAFDHDAILTVLEITQG